MIDRIADQVGERILDGFDKGFVELCFLAFHLQADLFPTTRRQITHDAREFAPNVSDRLHAGLHDPFLQFGGDQIQPLGRIQKCRVLLGGGKLQDLISGQDEFPDQVHQFVEQTHIDADVAFGEGRGARFRLPL